MRASNLKVAACLNPRCPSKLQGRAHFFRFISRKPTVQKGPKRARGGRGAPRRPLLRLAARSDGKEGVSRGVCYVFLSLGSRLEGVSHKCPRSHQATLRSTTLHTTLHVRPQRARAARAARVAVEVGRPNRMRGVSDNFAWHNCKSSHTRGLDDVG